MLLAGVAFAWPTDVLYFGLHPPLMMAALSVAFVMYLPSLWAVRALDRQEPELRHLFWGAMAFVIIFAPVTARIMHGAIDAGMLPYWVIVGPMEEMTKLLPLLLIAWLAPANVNSMRDGIVYGALGGLGFAIVEFGAIFATSGYAADGWSGLSVAIPGRWALGTDAHIIWGATAGVGVGYMLWRRGRGLSVPIGLGIIALMMATHGLNDLDGKYIGPLSTLLLSAPMQAMGVDIEGIQPGSPLQAAMLVFAAVANVLVVNLLLWPILIWGIRLSGRTGRTDQGRTPGPA